MCPAVMVGMCCHTVQFTADLDRVCLGQFSAQRALHLLLPRSCRLGAQQVAAQAAAIKQSATAGGAHGRGALGTSVTSHSVRPPRDADSWHHDATFFAGSGSAGGGDTFSDREQESYDQVREKKRQVDLEARAEALQGASLRKRVPPPTPTVSPIPRGTLRLHVANGLCLHSVTRGLPTCLGRITDGTGSELGWV
jgi:hypothetical protein